MVIAIEIQMHMLEKCFIAGDARRVGLGQGFFGVTKNQPVAGALLRHLPDGGVDPRVGAERQRVRITRDLKLLRRGGVRQRQLALGEAEMRLGKLRFQFGGWREQFGGGQKITLRLQRFCPGKNPVEAQPVRSRQVAIGK
jgi:hypothetical protein